MEFVFETVYDRKALAAMAKVLRKTVRRKRSVRAHIFGWIAVVLGLLFSLPLGNEAYVIDAAAVVTWIAVILIVIVLIWEDQINAVVSVRRILVGTRKATSVFCEEGYCSVSEMGKTEWHYEKIGLIAETADYFVFVFSKNHAQVYDKRRLTGGSADSFCRFIAKRTGKDVIKIK